MNTYVDADGKLINEWVDARTVLATPLALFAAGCGYSIRPPYDATVRTVYVPIFRNITFNRDIHLQVTEAVQKEIPKRTPYKVVGTPDGADTPMLGAVKAASMDAVATGARVRPVWAEEREGRIEDLAHWELVEGGAA